MIENEPKVVNSDMNAAPCWSATLMKSCRELSASSPSRSSVGFKAAITEDVPERPSRLPTRNESTIPGRPNSRCAVGSEISRPLAGAAPPV